MKKIALLLIILIPMIIACKKKETATPVARE
jgi:hypothetical protein